MESISGKTKICIIIGDPIEASLSPLIHNAGYQACDIGEEFVFVAARVESSAIGQAVAGLKVLGVRGITCTMPHKTTVMQYLDEIDPIAAKIGAVNTVVRNGSSLKGYNTDWIGVVEPLQDMVKLQGVSVALLGAGGAARAACYGLSAAGAEVTVYNRSIDRASQLASDFGCSSAPVELFSKDHRIVVNATSVGMAPGIDESPLPPSVLHREQIVFDMVYHPLETRLIRDARKAGAHAIYGTEMLLHQAGAQFKLYTGRAAPLDSMRQALAPKVKIK
ncbi:MAG: shikimate dehydrogenase [Deltaproteobacteria bacterium]|nr:shikimate dehydrogenase [Deltaproteobacteria bacterium]